MTYNINLGLRYSGTNFERVLTIPDVAEADAAIATVRNKVEALNASIADDADLKNFFRSDDFDADNNIGAFAGISSCEVKVVDETVIV